MPPNPVLEYSSADNHVFLHKTHRAAVVRIPDVDRICSHEQLGELTESLEPVT